MDTGIKADGIKDNEYRNAAFRYNKAETSAEDEPDNKKGEVVAIVGRAGVEDGL
jgi:hypothetical protein